MPYTLKGPSQSFRPLFIVQQLHYGFEFFAFMQSIRSSSLDGLDRFRHETISLCSVQFGYGAKYQTKAPHFEAYVMAFVSETFEKEATQKAQGPTRVLACYTH